MTATLQDYNNSDAHVIVTAADPGSYTLDTLEDNLYEGDETFQVHIGEVLFGECREGSDTDNTLTVTIREDDCKSYKGLVS